MNTLPVSSLLTEASHWDTQILIPPLHSRTCVVCREDRDMVQGLLPYPLHFMYNLLNFILVFVITMKKVKLAVVACPVDEGVGAGGSAPTRGG